MKERQKKKKEWGNVERKKRRNETFNESRKIIKIRNRKDASQKRLK